MLDTDGTLQLKVDAGDQLQRHLLERRRHHDVLHRHDDQADPRLRLRQRAAAPSANASIAVDTAAHGYDSSPDGMTIDANGNLWVAFCHGGCVTCFDPTTGKELRKVELPCVETTACAFGGAEARSLVRHHRDSQQQSKKPTPARSS